MAEIEETAPRNRHGFAELGDVETGNDVRGDLARVEFTFLGQAHEGGGFVIAVAGIGTWSEQHAGQIRVGQDVGNGLVEGRLELGDEHLGSEGALVMGCGPSGYGRGIRYLLVRKSAITR